MVFKNSVSLFVHYSKSVAMIIRNFSYSCVRSCRTNLAATCLICKSSVRMAWYNQMKMPISSLICLHQTLHLNCFSLSAEGKPSWILITLKWCCSALEMSVSVKDTGMTHCIIFISFFQHFKCLRTSFAKV